MWKRTTIRVILPAILLYVFAGRLAEGATCYVAPHGDDSDPGTETQPWKTLQKAAHSVEPGDTVRIKAGDYSVRPSWSVNRAGTAERPITYQAYGDGEVRINPSSVIPPGNWTLLKDAIYCTPVTQHPAYVFRNSYPLHSPGDRAKIYSVDDMIPNSFYVDVTTLYVWLEDGSDPGKSEMRTAASHVVELRDCHYTIFDGLTVEYGFNGFKDQGKATHHVTYRNCTIRSIGSQGIQPVPQDAVIERNLFQKIGANKWQHGIYNSKPGLIVRHNVFEEIAGAAIHQFHEGSPAGGGCQFYGNVFRKPRKMTMRPAGGRSPYYVEIIAWGEGNNKIYNNVFFGEGKRGGISLNSVNNRVYHNTFVDSFLRDRVPSGKPGNQVVNNLVEGAARSFLRWPAKALPQSLDYNLYHNIATPPQWQRDGVAYESFPLYQAASGEKHSRYADPKLAGSGDAHLRPGSAAIDAGKGLAEISEDLDRVARPQGAVCDIGAFESKAEAP